MRKILTIILLACTTMSMAQEKRVYFFPDFIPSRIIYKTGTRYKVSANYDAANRKMMYMQNGTLMELVNPELVDTIYTGGRAWVYRNKQFCEVVQREGIGEVLVAWHITKVHEGYKGAYGVSQVPSRKIELTGDFGMGNLTGEGGVGGIYNGSSGTNANDGNGINLDVWRNRNLNTYYFNKDGKTYEVKNLKSVYKLFPDKKAQIKQYLHDNNLDMMNADNALKVIDYLVKM